MGYRHYFYKVKKDDVATVKDMDFDQLCRYAQCRGVELYDEDVDGCRGFYFNDDKFLNKIEVFEFGKLYWDDTADRIYSKGVPLFTIKETQDNFDDYVPYVVGKGGLLEAIAIYREKVINIYRNLMEENDIEKIKSHIHDHAFWSGQIVDTDENHKYLTRSWLYEHHIFDLVYLLKTIDWETETLLFYGW